MTFNSSFEKLTSYLTAKPIRNTSYAYAKSHTNLRFTSEKASPTTLYLSKRTVPGGPLASKRLCVVQEGQLRTVKVTGRAAPFGAHRKPLSCRSSVPCLAACDRPPDRSPPPLRCNTGTNQTILPLQYGHQPDHPTTAIEAPGHLTPCHTTALQYGHQVTSPLQ